MSTSVAESDQISRSLLREEVTEWLYREAELLDDQNYSEWLDTVADDVRYEMPLRLNVEATRRDRNQTVPGSEVCWFDEDKETLEKRIDQIATNVHWAEEPLSRVTRMVSNVRIAESSDDGIVVRSTFMVYRNRVADETDIMVGRRRDTLRREPDGSLKLAHRYITLDQAVLLAKNITVIF